MVLDEIKANLITKYMYDQSFSLSWKFVIQMKKSETTNCHIPEGKALAGLIVDKMKSISLNAFPSAYETIQRMRESAQYKLVVKAFEKADDVQGFSFDQGTDFKVYSNAVDMNETLHSLVRHDLQQKGYIIREMFGTDYESFRVKLPLEKLDALP